jgi:2-polyprenyl-3-methyl-5-hydroxy-6-metoxy-1,4-benzoquinol methylase
MEKYMSNKVYIISGMGASGKTTFAEKLSKELNIPWIKGDDVYRIVQRKLGISNEKLRYAPMLSYWEDPTKLDLENWLEYGSMKECVKSSWLEFLNFKFPPSIIIESVSLFWNPLELEAVKDVFENYDFRYFWINVDYERWLKNRSKRVGTMYEGYPPFDEETKYREAIDTLALNHVPKDAYIIKDITNTSCSLTGGVAYQSEDFSNPKWSVFDINVKDKTFFEVSCNTGWFSSKALEEGAKIVEGCDISWQVLDIAKDRCPKGVFYHSKIEDFDFKDKMYDIILSSSAFHYYTRREEVIKKISEHCNMFVLETPVIEKECLDIVYKGGQNDEFCAIPTEELLLKWLNKYFSKVEKAGYTKQPDSNDRPVFKCYK